MGRQGSQQVRKEHSAETMVKKIHELYVQLLSQNGFGVNGCQSDCEIENRSGLVQQESKVGTRLR